MFIKLNGVSYPDINDGKPTPVYVVPSFVYMIHRSIIKPPGDPAGPDIECTVVRCGGAAAYVTDDPDEVAMAVVRCGGAAAVTDEPQ